MSYICISIWVYVFDVHPSSLLLSWLLEQCKMVFGIVNIFQIKWPKLPWLPNAVIYLTVNSCTNVQPSAVTCPVWRNYHVIVFVFCVQTKCLMFTVDNILISTLFDMKNARYCLCFDVKGATIWYLWGGRRLPGKQTFFSKNNHIMHDFS